MRREPADLVVVGGRVVSVHTREVLDGVDVAVKHGRVAMFGDARHTVGPETRRSTQTAPTSFRASSIRTFTSNR
jgi:adenine deaminase